MKDFFRIISLSVLTILGIICVFTAGMNVLSFGNWYALDDKENIKEVAISIGKRISHNKQFGQLKKDRDRKYVEQQIRKAVRHRTRTLQLYAFAGSLPTVLGVVYFSVRRTQHKQ